MTEDFQDFQNEQADLAADVLESTTLLGCHSQNQKSRFKNCGVIAKVPVVIAEPKLQVNVESTIRLESPALEIKRILKSLFLTQCELIPTDDKRSGKLFLSGFVRKNIEYATTTNVRVGAVSGDIRHTTVNVPFNCFTKIDYLEFPDFEANDGPVQLDIIGCDCMGRDSLEQNSIQTQRFNERVFCELVEAKFREKDIILDPVPYSAQFPNVRVFDTLIEKMVIDITIKVLQKQQVEIPKAHRQDDDDKCGKGGKDYCRNDWEMRDNRDRCSRDDWEMRDNKDRCSRDDWKKRENWDRCCSGKKTACWRD